MKYKALVNIGAKPPIAAGEIFEDGRIKHIDLFIKSGQVIALKKEVKKKEVK